MRKTDFSDLKNKIYCGKRYFSNLQRHFYCGKVVFSILKGVFYCGKNHFSHLKNGFYARKKSAAAFNIAKKAGKNIGFISKKRTFAAKVIFNNKAI